MSARDAVLASTDLVDELMVWGLGAWDRHRPSYEFTCPEKTVAVPLNQLLHVLMDERPWADELNEYDVADAVRCWLRGVLRSIVTRRRVCKTWAVAGKRCFETLVAELRDRGAAHARAARAFLQAQPESYPGQLPSDYVPEPSTERTNLVRPWSRDDEGAKHVPLLQALFEYPFRHIGTPVTPITEEEAYFSFFAKHSVWPRSWVQKLAGLMMPINERQLWDTLHRRCRCCPRGSRCCVQKDRRQMTLRSGGDGYGTAFGQNDNYEVGPWPETDIGGNNRVGRSVLAADSATVTMSMTAVCEPVRERDDGSPCMLCNWCEQTTLPYTSKLDTVTLCFGKSEGKICVQIVEDEPYLTSNELLMAMFLQGSRRNSPVEAKLLDLLQQRMDALSAAPGARAHCKCAKDYPNKYMTVTLTMFEAEEGSNHSWASLFGLTRAQFQQEAVQWRRLKDAPMETIERWSKMELRRRVSLLNETLPGRIGDNSIMIRDERGAFYHKFYKHNYVICSNALVNDEHLYMYAPLRRLFQMMQSSMEHSSDDVESSFELARAKVYSISATTKYEETFGTDEAMIDYFQTVESLLGAAWMETLATGESHVFKIDDRHHALRRIAQAYIDAKSDLPPLTDDDKMKALASIPAMAPTHPLLLLRWFLAAICLHNKYNRDGSLDVRNVTWMPSTTRPGPPPEKLACQDVVVNLSFSAPESIDPIYNDWPRHMRFAFALRMHHLCDLSTTMTKREDRVQDRELGLKAWLEYANSQVYGLNRMCMLDESNLTLLLLFERILQLPWVPVFFPRRRTDPAEGTCGISALGSVCNRGSWYGDVHPVLSNGNPVCKERGLDCCQCSRECNF